MPLPHDPLETNTFEHEPFGPGKAFTVVEKPWGKEELWAATDTYVGKFLHVNAGKRLSLQYHDQKRETQTLVSGKAILWRDNADGVYEPIEMERGVAYDNVPYQRHRLEGIEDAVILEVSTPETGMTYRLQDDTNRADETEEMRARPGRV